MAPDMQHSSTDTHTQTHTHTHTDTHTHTHTDTDTDTHTHTRTHLLWLIPVCCMLLLRVRSVDDVRERAVCDGAADHKHGPQV